MKIILFDMDGVLLHSLGYHRALQQTVKLVGEAMGYSGIELSDEHIAAFESQGITCEWYSGAMCTTYLYMQALNAGQDGQYPDTLSENANKALHHQLTPEPLYEALADVPLEGYTQLERVIKASQKIMAEYGLLEDQISAILQQSEDPYNSLTFRTFQELVLGSQQFQKTYSLPAVLDTESYLSMHDIPLLAPEKRDALNQWLQSDENHAAILTNRPSLQIAGTPSTPEAEIGARLVGLDDMPIVGIGEIIWLADREGLDSGTLNKPAPVHALASLLAAAGSEPADSMLNAYQLVNGEMDSPTWAHLENSDVYILEDTAGGIISLERAAQVLEAQGIHIRIHKFGISPSLVKQEALKAYGADIFDDINQALADIIKKG